MVSVAHPRPSRVAAVGFSPPSSPPLFSVLQRGTCSTRGREIRVESGPFVMNLRCLVRGAGSSTSSAVRAVKAFSTTNWALAARSRTRARAKSHLFSLRRPCPPKPRPYHHEHADRASAWVWEVQLQFDEAAFSTNLGSHVPRRRLSSFPYGRRLAVTDRPRRRLATARCEKYSAVSGRRRTVPTCSADSTVSKATEALSAGLRTKNKRPMHAPRGR